jgi:hypothetical protein
MGHVVYMGDMRSTYKILRESDSKRLLGRPRCRMDNINMGP